MQENEERLLQDLMALEDLAEKKAKIYARLLIDPAIAQDMDKISTRHQERKNTISSLLYVKKGGGDSSET